MIRQEVCAQATSSRTLWRRAKMMGWDDQTRGLRSSDEFTYELEEGKDDDDVDGMIRQEVCAQATSSRTSWRRAKMMGWVNQTRGLHSSDKFTYSLDEGKDDGMG